jgi:hypothetical protein
MGNVLDAILKKIMIDGPVTVNSGYISQVVDIDGREGEFSIQLTYQNSVAPALTVRIQTSNDLQNWVDVDNSEQDIDNAADTMIWDIAGMGTSYIRLIISGTGSSDVVQALYVAKRRH